MNETKKNDFLAIITKNPELSLVDFKDAGITAENSSLLTKEEYMAMPKVVDAFKTPTGEFDQKKFDSVYKDAQIQYATMAEDSLFDNITRNLSFGPDAWYAPADAIKRDTSPIMIVDQKPFDYSQGISYITELSGKKNKLSVREIAQTQKVVDYETGEELDYTPNDKAGLFSWFSLPSMALAQWDEDGTHEENGITIPHKAGDLKFNAEGKPYYETLSGREMYGKDLLRRSDILTVDGSKWNKVDIFDSDDVKKGAGKVALELVAKVAPLFIPYVGEVYGYVSAANAIARVMPVFGKTVNGLISGTNDNSIGEFLTNWENRAAAYDTTASDYGRDHFVSFENIGNLVADISKQLFEQRAVSTLPTLIAKANGVKDLKSVSDVSKNLSLAYMAATSAQETYGAFKEAGANDTTASLGMLASTLALYKLMNIDYFRDNLFKDTFMDESEIRSAVRGVSKETADALANAARLETPQKAATFLNKVSNFYQDTMLKGLSKKGVPGLINRGVSEGAEETMEEVTTDLVKATTTALDALGIKTTKDDEPIDFGFSASDIIQRYIASFGGGFLGGMIFAGQHRYEKWLNNKLTGQSPTELPDIEKLIYYIATGKRSEIDYYLDRWHEKGLLGSEELSIDGEVTKTLDGQERFIPKTTGISQNDAVYKTLKNTLDTYEQAINQEIDLRYMSKEGIDQLRVLGYDTDEILKNPKLIGTSTLVALKDYNNFQNALYDNLTELVKTKIALQARVQELSEKPAETQDERKTVAKGIEEDLQVKQLQEKLKKLRKEKEAFFNGAKNRYYSGQALFAADSNLNKNFVDLSLDTYVKTRYGRGLNSFTDEQQNKIKEEHENYLDTEGRNNVYKAYDLYLDLSSKFVAPIEAQGKQLDETFDQNNVPTLLGLSDLANIQAEQEQQLQRYKQLEDKQNLTPEEEQEKLSLQSSLTELSKKLLTVINNPELAISEASLAEDLDLFIEGSNEKNKLLLFDDKVPSKSKITNALLNSLLTQYQADKSKYRFDDGELNAFYDGIKKAYKASGGANTWMQAYFNLVEKYYDDDGNVIPKVALATAIDPYDPEWFIQGNSAEASIKKTVDALVDSLGNDVNVMKYYTELQDIIKNKSKLLDSGNESYLNEFLNTLLPVIGGKNIVDIVQEFSELKNEINYSAFIELAKNIGTDAETLSLFDVLEKERKNVISSETLQDYIMQNPIIKDSLSSEKLDPVFKVIRAVVTGAADGTNDIINNFKHIDGDTLSKLPILSERAAKHILQQAQYYEGEIAYLRALSAVNSAKTLRVHKDTALNMGAKWAKSLTDLSQEYKDMWGDYSFNPTEDTYAAWENHFIDFEQKIYDKYTGKTPEEVVKDILSNFNVKSLYNAPNTLLNADPETKISPLDLIYHLATITSISPTEFYRAYAGTIDTYKKDGKGIIPIYGQEYATRQILAQIKSPTVFNGILSEIKKSAVIDPKINDVFKVYVNDKLPLYNLATVLGSAGSGKTIGVIKTILDTVTNTGGKPEVIFVAREQEQADNVRDGASPNSRAYNIDDYLKLVYGESISPDSYVIKNGHLLSNNALSFKGTAFDVNAPIKLLVVDEIETLSEAELTRLSADAQRHGIFIIGMGDLKQPSTTFRAKNEGKTEFRTSGLEDTYFVKTPTLTTSMRAQTIAKKENANLMANALDAVINVATEHPEMSLLERSNLLNSNLKSRDLYYWEDKNTGEVFGDMKVSSSKDLETYINNLSKLGTVGIIYTGTNKYKQFEVPGKVFTIPYEKRAGGEYDYVISDVDFEEVDSRNEKIDPYLFTQDLYTITQRSRKGSVIKIEGDSLFNFVPDETKAQVSIISDTERDSFMKWMEGVLQPYMGQEFPKLFEDSNIPSSVTPASTTPTPTANVTAATNATTPTTPTNTTTVQTPAPNTSVTTESGTDEGTPTSDAEAQQKDFEEYINQMYGAATPVSVNSAPESSPIDDQGYLDSLKAEIEETTPPPETGEITPPPQVPPAKPKRKKLSGFEAYFNSSEGITTSSEFYALLDNSFPYIGRELKKSIDSSLSLDDLKNPLNPVHRKLEKIVSRVYGQPGLNVLNKMFASPYKGSKEIFEELGKLTPLDLDVSFNGQLRKSKKGDFIGRGFYYPWINAFGLKWDGQENSYKDIRTVPELADGFKDPLVWNNFVERIGSYVRTGLYDPSIVTTKNLYIDMALKTFLNGGYTTTWISPYEKDLSLISYRFYSANGNYFDIPVLLIQGNSYFGEYKGTIDLVKPDSITKEATTHIPLNDFLKENGFYAGEKSGVITVHSEDSLSNLDERTAKYVRENNGKVMCPITCELAIKEKILDSDTEHGVFKTDADGKSVTDYQEYTLVGIQSLVDFDTLLEAINQYRKLAGYSSNKEVLISTNGESGDTAPIEAIANATLLRSDGEKGKIRQLISKNKTDAIVGICALYSKNTAFALSGFLNPLNQNGHKDVHWLDITLGKNKVSIGNINGELHWVTLDSGKLRSLGKVGPKAGEVINFELLFKAAFKDYNENNIPAITLRGMHDYTKNGNVIHYDHNYSSNWTLAFISENIAPNEKENISKAITNNVAKYGIFLDDKGIKDSAAPNSYYTILDPGNKIYYVNAEIQSIRTYAVNIKTGNPSKPAAKPAPTPAPEPSPAPAPKISPAPTISPLQKFINDNNLNITASSIEDANIQLKKKSNTWLYAQIVEENGEFKIAFTDDNNIKSWFKETYGMDILPEEEAYFIASMNPFERSVSDLFIGGRNAFYYTENGYKNYAFKEGESDIVNSAMYYTGEEYIAYRLFNIQPKDLKGMRSKVLSTIASDFEIAEKIAKFEEIMSC